MKKQILALALALCLCSPFQQTAYAGQGNPLEQERVLTKKAADKSVIYIAEYTETDVYSAIIKMKDIYPNGMTWTNDEPYGEKGDKEYYMWNGTFIRGRGCAAFAFELSDAAFGMLPARKYEKEEVKFEDIRVGDVLRTGNDTHSTIVLEINDDGIVTANGNSGGEVSWGGIMVKDKVIKNIAYYYTRYPESYIQPENQDATGTVTPSAVQIPNYAVEFTQADVYNNITKLKDKYKYPEGMAWTNDKPYGNNTAAYKWNGANESGMGCEAFAFKFNDELFGCLPGRKYAKGEFGFEDIKVGDILKLDNNTNSVVVSEVNNDGVAVVEGNYNGSGKVQWGRKISKDEVMGSATCYYTRYPEKYIVQENPDATSDTEEPSVNISKDNVGEKITVNNINYEITSVEGTKTVKVTGIEKATKEVIIPSVIPFNKSRYKVTDIGSSAFKSNKNLLKIEIGTNINSIGENAFNGCKNLKNITIKSNKLVAGKVGKNAFKGINNNAIIKVPKKKIKAYKKIIKAAGAGKNIMVINLYMVYYGM